MKIFDGDYVKSRCKLVRDDFICGNEHWNKGIIEKNKLNLIKVNSYPDDYAKTLANWKINFFKAWNNITPLGFDETFKRMWEFYLSYCEAGFKSKNINLIQISMSNK